jgi:hypothetical protein
MMKRTALLVLLSASIQPGGFQAQRSSYERARNLLSSMGDVVVNSDTLAKLFRTGDENIADLIELLGDSDKAISLRAQIVIRYLNNEAGMKALAAYLAGPGERLIAGPAPLPGSQSERILSGGPDLARLAQQNCSCVSTEDREYGHARILALTTKGDKALIEIYINRGALMEEWYHVVMKKDDKGWRLVSVYQAGQS